MHRPMKWSDVRPSNTEFKAAYTRTKLSAGRIMNFVAQRAAHIRKLVLLNSEGYWSGARQSPRAQECTQLLL